MCFMLTVNYMPYDYCERVYDLYGADVFFWGGGLVALRMCCHMI